MNFLTTSLLFLILGAGMLQGQTNVKPHNYVLIYQYDSGQCIPSLAYAERGCTHQHVMGREYFATENEALTWLDDHTEQESMPSGVYIVVTPRIDRDSVELLKIGETVPLNFVISSEMYQTYETKKELVSKPRKKWKVEPSPSPKP